MQPALSAADDPRTPENLFGLTQLRLETQIDCADSIARYVPFTQRTVENFVSSMLRQAGVEVTSSTSAPVLTVSALLRFATEPVTRVNYWSCRTEIMLRDAAKLERLERLVLVDVWRHRANVGIFRGIVKPLEIGQYLQADLARQLETLVQDWRAVNELGGAFSGVGKSDRVTRAIALLRNNPRNYPQGCSEFVSEVLGIAWENANQLMGNQPVAVGDNNNYSGLNPGDIVGWKSGTDDGHVAVYVGQSGGPKIIDVKAPGLKPREMNAGYGLNRPVYKSSRF